MTGGPVLIKRYPNRRYYAHNTSKYVSLQDIEEMVKAGQDVEVRDSQTGDDLTRAVLTQIIMERHPEKMSLFPTDILHAILRSNDVVTGLMGDYFRHSVTYLEFLQRNSATARALVQPMHWMRAWLNHSSPTSTDDPAASPPGDDESLRQRVQQLEQRLEQLESQQ